MGEWKNWVESLPEEQQALERCRVAMDRAAKWLGALPHRQKPMSIIEDLQDASAAAYDQLPIRD